MCDGSASAVTAKLPICASTAHIDGTAECVASPLAAAAHHKKPTWQLPLLLLWTPAADRQCRRHRRFRGLIGAPMGAHRGHTTRVQTQPRTVAAQRAASLTAISARSFVFAGFWAAFTRSGGWVLR